MRIWSLRHAALGFCAAAMLTGCGGAQPLINAPGAMPQTSALGARSNKTGYKVVYNFGALPLDAKYPSASLTDVGGTLYGTTFGGGAYDFGSDGGGTVFSITPSGTEKVLHSFGSGSDGRNPSAGLIDVRGTLYGTTAGGGTNSDGTVFSITPNGTEKVLHNFGRGPEDGFDPVASLIEIKGTLYGTTQDGGGSTSSYGGGYGTVFSITPSGTEKVLHRFGTGSDGIAPAAALIEVNGKLYGTTSAGGSYSCYSCLGGTVFSITPSGTESVLHSFGNGTDGAVPLAALIEVKGKLYGTTAFGRESDCNLWGACGTVFSITPSGTEKVLHRFSGGTDGGSPVAPLIDVKGTLYGTTAYGGRYACDTDGCGTVFSITPSGKEKVLHSFGGSPDGEQPDASLTDVGGTLYGTTAYGGTLHRGDGTLFALRP